MEEGLEEKMFAFISVYLFVEKSLPLDDLISILIRFIMFIHLNDAFAELEVGICVPQPCNSCLANGCPAGVSLVKGWIDKQEAGPPALMVLLDLSLVFMSLVMPIA